MEPKYISLRESYARDAFRAFHGEYAVWKNASSTHRHHWMLVADMILNLLDDAHNRRDA